jgi:NosR/NirI family transcriptional regulator, nitrous oxide reductase regulator
MLRIALLLLALVAPGGAVSVSLAAQEPSTAPPPASAAAAVPGEAPPADDPWGFGDEEEEAEPSLLELAQAQWIDIALFAGFATLALVSFFRKSEKLKVVTLVAAVGYLGLYKSQLISIVNVFGLLVWNLPILKYSLGWYTFAIFTVVTTVLWGRLYCGRVCAFGSLTQLMDKVVPQRLRVNVPRTLERRAGYIKYGILAAVIAYYLVTRDHLIFRYVEPFWMFTFQGNAVMWTMLAVLLTATLFVRNLYCRFLCPVGAALGVISQVTTVFRIRRWSECGTCKICEKTCEWGAIRGPQIVRSECVRCDDCERLYANEQKCPHWIIFYRKDEIAARRAARAAAAASAQFTPSQGALR